MEEQQKSHERAWKSIEETGKSIKGDIEGHGEVP
jgi:hypothetical protein